jgi:hypothetical protein
MGKDGNGKRDREERKAGKGEEKFSAENQVKSATHKDGVWGTGRRFPQVYSELDLTRETEYSIISSIWIPR